MLAPLQEAKDMMEADLPAIKRSLLATGKAALAARSAAERKHLEEANADRLRREAYEAAEKARKAAEAEAKRLHGIATLVGAHVAAIVRQAERGIGSGIDNGSSDSGSGCESVRVQAMGLVALALGKRDIAVAPMCDAGSARVCYEATRGALERLQELAEGCEVMLSQLQGMVRAMLAIDGYSTVKPYHTYKES